MLLLALAGCGGDAADAGLLGGPDGKGDTSAGAPVARTTLRLKLRPVAGTCRQELALLPRSARVTRRAAAVDPEPCGLDPEEASRWVAVSWTDSAGRMLDGWVYNAYLSCPSSWHDLAPSGSGYFKVTTYFTGRDEQDFIDRGQCSRQLRPRGLDRPYCYEFLCHFSGVAGQGTGKAADGRHIKFIANAPGGSWRATAPSAPESLYSGCDQATFAVADAAIGAAGRPLVPEGSVAVHPCAIPLGAAVFVRTADGQVATYRADDTGGMVTGNHIDIYRGPYDLANAFVDREAFVEWEAP